MLKLRLLLLLLLLPGMTKAADFLRAPLNPIQPPSQKLVQDLNLKPFYRKCLDVSGLPVLSSEKVSDYALREAAYLISEMLRGREDVLKAMAKNKVRFVVMGYNELTTMVPEHSDLTPSKFWDRRARGLGATPERPAVSCGEENLLHYPGDPYATENILVHEFAHAIHDMGLNTLDPDFDTRLKRIYDAAMAKGLWKGKYAATNHHEYWAEGVQSWFDTNRPPDHDHNEVNTREELQEYDPELAALIAETFPNKRWRYTRATTRLDLPHLKGYAPARTPRFAWDPALQEWYRNYEAEQKQKQQKKD